MNALKKVLLTWFYKIYCRITNERNALRRTVDTLAVMSDHPEQRHTPMNQAIISTLIQSLMRYPQAIFTRPAGYTDPHAEITPSGYGLSARSTSVDFESEIHFFGLILHKSSPRRFCVHCGGGNDLERPQSVSLAYLEISEVTDVPRRIFKVAAVIQQSGLDESACYQNVQDADFVFRHPEHKAQLFELFCKLLQ